MRRWLSKILLISSAVLLAVSVWFLVGMFLDYRAEKGLDGRLKDLYENAGLPEDTPLPGKPADGEEPGEAGTEAAVDEGLLALHRENADCIYWIRIPDTAVDYPVMYRPQEKDYFLHRNFYGEYGNRDYLFDLDTIPTYTVDGSYGVPPEALSDERFARMYAEAVKYLGVPYVWGGYSPSGFDCSGFVSWVINNCGNGWNYGRMTAEGIRQVCSFVAPSDAQPGDIIFFEKTYDTTGASHVGIYLGDGKMIHCGKPVQIVSIKSQYWSDHFLQFGRLP